MSKREVTETLVFDEPVTCAQLRKFLSAIPDDVPIQLAVRINHNNGWDRQEAPAMTASWKEDL